MKSLPLSCLLLLLCDSYSSLQKEIGANAFDGVGGGKIGLCSVMR